MLRQQPPWLESINREVRVDAMAMVMIALTGNPAWYVLTGAGRPFDSTPREFFDALQAEVPLDPERLAEYHQWVASQFEALRPFDAIPPA